MAATSGIFEDRSDDTRLTVEASLRPGTYLAVSGKFEEVAILLDLYDTQRLRDTLTAILDSQ